MTLTTRTIYTKILGSLMVPVFLFLPISPAIASPSPDVTITFEINNAADNQAVLSHYGLQATLLFGNIFKATVSQREYAFLRTDPKVNYAQLDQKVLAARVVASDSFFTTDPLAESQQWYLAKTRVPDAWEYTKGSNSVVIAIVDTGIHANHIELNDGRIIAGFNTVTNQPIQANTNSDDNGHGTVVAGVIGAIPNNKKGIAGINWNTQIMPVKALAADGTGESSAVAAGIVWATDHGANIINLSLGGTGVVPDATLINAVTYAYNKGVLIVSAAGNDLAAQGLNLDKTPVYPICADNGNNMILGVAATNVNDVKTGFSNFGKSCVDISAPGEKIVTTAYLPNDPEDNILIYGSGTSLAAPIVSGIAALLKASNPNLSNVEIRNTLIKTADNIDILNQTSCLDTSCNGLIGSGRVNALAAIVPPPIVNGSLVREISTGLVYLVLNNTKRLISGYVFTQRGFNPAEVSSQLSSQLANLPTSFPLPPLDGTLLKSLDDNQVYVVDSQLKRPVTYPVFITRGYNFANIVILPNAEISAYQLGEWYWPPDGTMVVVSGNPTVYVMANQVRRAVTYFVFTQRKLSFAKVLTVTPDEFSHVPQAADLHWLSPLDNTLIKSDTDPSIYVIENSTKRMLSFESFNARGYSFRNVKILPEAEISVIAPGLAIL